MYQTVIILMCALFTVSGNLNVQNTEIKKRALQKEHEKPKPVQWAEKFLKQNHTQYQVQSLVKLLHVIAKDHLNNCTVQILYDSKIEINRLIIEKLFTNFPAEYEHGNININSTLAERFKKINTEKCISYMLFLKDVMRSPEIIGNQHENKVIIVSTSSQWRVHEFLASDTSKKFVNLLVISKSERIITNEEELPYILYTHKMYIDGLGRSKPYLLMSWYKDKLTKPNSPVFPRKMVDGFAGHRFIISVADQPPFVINTGSDSDEDDIIWDGLEIRLVRFLADMLNFTTDFQEADDVNILGASDAVAKVIREGKAYLGIAGLYVTRERIESFEMSHGHSYDCAAFISLTSTALPKYRAIMGPFQWTVWLALIVVYLFAIFPISFSDHLTLAHLLKKPGEMENMFWYVFGTFTNCFTFVGKNSWSKTKKVSTRLFIGWYWVFTIIITACYTGSIIAFVTLPVYPSTVDTVQQLLSGHFQVGTLDKDGWQYWFQNSSDPKVDKLLKNLEYLPNIASGLKNITNAFFWPYAFLGSRDQLQYVIQTNFTQTSKRAIMHISSECFAPFSVSIALPKSSVYKGILNTAILRIFQSGLATKMKNDVEWDTMRSASGAYLQANSIGKFKSPTAEDRSLTLQDTQGMFLLLGAGFLIGFSVLLSEWLGGCFNFCKTGRRSRYNSLSTNPKSFHVPTPTELHSTELEFNPYDGKTSNASDKSSFENNEETDDQLVIVHNNVQPQENMDGQPNADESVSPLSITESSEVENEISNLFNFDHLFGENNSGSEDSYTSPTDYFGERCKHEL